jgi:hypothetical protein
MTTRNPASASAQGTAAHRARVKTDAEFYDSLEYDRTRYTEDIAVAARVFLIAVRNALRCDPIGLETVSAGRVEPLLNDKNKAAASAAPARAVTSAGTGSASASAAGPAAAAAAAVASSSAAAVATPAEVAARTGGNNADRKNNPTAPQVDATVRGTKRPAPGPPSRNGNTSSQKQKKTKRSPTTSNAGSAAADAAGTSGGSDGSNGRTAAAAAGHNGTSAVGGGGGNTSIPPRSDVACKVKEDGKVSWILAKVSRYVSELKKYEVTDSGDDERVKKHMVFKKNIRVLPKKPFDFENKQRVLAVYPDTTVFYPATVTGRRGKYIQCLFDDEEDIMYPTKEVDARFVIHPESG